MNGIVVLFIGLVFSATVWARPLLEDRVQLRSGKPVADVAQAISYDRIVVISDPQIYNDNVFVLPVTDSLAAGNLPLREYAARFYEYFEDEFDFLLFFQPPGPFNGAFFVHVKNDVQGIGLSIFSNNGSWASAGKLQGVLVHNYDDPSNFQGLILHELMHQWGNFVVPITSYPYGAHWGLSTSGGYLDCYDISNMIDHGDGKFAAPDPFYFRSSEQYSPIELYLAGFIPPEEVPDFQNAEDGEWLLDERGLPVEDDHGYRMFTASGFKTHTSEDIIAEHGPRVPDYLQSQKDFRAAAILLTSEDYPATQGLLDRLSDDLIWFSHAGRDESGLPVTNFYEATGGRGAITMDGLSRFRKGATGGQPATLDKLSGYGHHGLVGTVLNEPFIVEVGDENGNPLKGVQVTFAITAGGGMLSAEIGWTDENGLVSTTLTLGSQPGQNVVQVAVEGLRPETFTVFAQSTPDFDGSGVVDFGDFFLFADAFGTTDARFDLDGSGVVDFGDFFIFADAFGQPTRAKLIALAREWIGLPDQSHLQQNAPNPFNSQTIISYFLLKPGPVLLEVYALTGQRVAVLQQGHKHAGLHRIHWDGHSLKGHPLASGTYLYRLVTADEILTRKLTLLK